MRQDRIVILPGDFFVWRELVTHEVFTIVAPVIGDRNVSNRLRALLEVIRQDPSTNRLLPFRKLPMVHFASFVVFSDPVQAEHHYPPPSIPEQLVFESCIDGPFEAYVDALLHLGLQALHDIFSCCTNYEPKAPSENALREFFRQQRRKPQLLHIGNPGMRVDHIKAGQCLREALDAELDEVVRHGRSTDRPLDLMRALRARLNVPPSTRHHWFLEEPLPQQPGIPRFAWFADQQSQLGSRLWHWGKLIALVSLAVALGGLALYWLWRYGQLRAVLAALVAVGFASRAFWWWLTWGRRMKRLTPKQVRDITAIKELEDEGVQNKMASLVILKSGWHRALVTGTVLWLFNLAYRTWFTDITPGRLAGLHTIHFGHWTMLDLQTESGTKLKAVMFLSNYDGSWETYLDDFLMTLLSGVVAIWAGGVGFPSPLDGPTFKTWARTRMSVWHAWYQAYPDLTVANIENDDKIRQGLVDLPGTDDAARLWLSRFGSFKTGNEHIDAPGDALETHEIQGLVLSGYAHLTHAKYVLLQINEPDGVRRWLATLIPHVTDARPSPRGLVPAVNIAFTHSGLQALGVHPGALERFPPAFREGMAPTDLHHRSRLLGDVGRNDPSDWVWGGGPPDKRVDLLLMVYATTKGELDSVVRSLLRNVCTSGAATMCPDPPLDGQLMPDGTNPAGRPLFREHFGFADGISQPEIEGGHRASKRVADRGSIHLVKPGEFVLGYADGDGTVAAGISIDARLDPYALLPPAGSGQDGVRDLGRNGTFLVFRQLEQDVPEFRKFIEGAAGASASPQDAEEFAARLVGRHRDGKPLIEGDSERTRSNEFTYADPHGFACPVGAHIRRANPRDSLAADPAAALKSANRHRLLRRGRPYGPSVNEAGQPNASRGMLFICLNADIERQFEFVQQNWINNTVFGGLADEQDGLVGAPGGTPGCFTVQSQTVRQRTLKIPAFITVKGGEYFFLPGLSTLRYIASLAGIDARTPAGFGQSVLAPFVGRQPSRLRRALVAFEGQLPRIRLAWAARYPLLMAFVLVFWPVAAARSATFMGSHFLVGWWGLTVVSLLASLAAFAVMISLRLVLLYGWRSRPGPPRWTGSARWLQVLGFQSLSLPLVIAAIHSSALDDAGFGGRSYWDLVLRYAGAAALGWLAAVVLMTLASSLQALRRGARADLFFPPNPLSRRLAGPGGFRAALRRPAQWLSRLSRWIVSSVPEEIGAGYIDYRRQRMLPGHAFAASVALILLLVYVVGYLTLNPAWESQWTRWGREVPALAYLIFVLIAFGSLLSMLAFFFDRYGIPTLLPLALWLAVVASVARTDHFYRVLDRVQPELLPAAEVVRRGYMHYPGSKVIVVASEGYGLTSSAWTAEVLATLAERAGGRLFTDSLRLVSASSGASLGTLYFVAAYENRGFPTAEGGQAVDAGTLARIREAAWQPSDSENAWGLVYPDLTRTFAPLFVPSLLDRGWAMEQAWKRSLRNPAATLNGWRQDVAEGWRPSTAFGVTLVETGGRHLFATYDANPCAVPVTDCEDRVTGHRDLPVVTAARLASTFPYVAPVARAQIDSPSYHLSDGGLWDNFGVVAAVEWLKQAAPALVAKEVLLVEIRSSSVAQQAPEDRAWTFELLGPLRAMNGVRGNAQRARNDLEVSLLKDLWSSSNGAPPLAHAIFELSDSEAKLSWRIGRHDVQRMKNAWSLSANQAALTTVQQFLGVQ
jgi:Dyp-type peroxidase family